MNARTDIAALADAPATPRRPVLGSLLSRWRARLQTWRRPHRVMLAATAGMPDRGAASATATRAFEAWAAQNEGANVELSLSSQWLLMLADDGAADAGGARALRERAIERWTHYLDLPNEGFEDAWLVLTSCDLARSPVSVACALQRSFCEGLQQAAARHGVKLRAIVPWWAEGLQQAWRALPPPDGSNRLWAWREGAWQTQARVAAEPGRWVLRSLALVAGAEAIDEVAPAGAANGADSPHEVFEAPMTAEVTPMPDRAPAARLAVLTRQATPGWAESLNFAGPRVRPSFWSWALLALGAVAIVHALDLADQVDQAQEAAQAELSRLQAHAQSHVPPRAQVNDPASSSPSAQAPGPRSGDAPSLSPEAWRSAAQLAAWLAHPWAPALDQADATAHKRGVALSRFQLDLGAWGTRADQPLAWRLQAAVPDDATAMAWVQDLGPSAELQRRDALAQPIASERGTLAWRVDVSSMGEQP